MITKLIEPVEMYVIERLAHSIAVQELVIKKIHLCVQDGRSACYSDEMGRMHRLKIVHDHLLALHTQIAKVGDRLHELEQMNSDGMHSEEEIPF